MGIKNCNNEESTKTNPKKEPAVKRLIKDEGSRIFLTSTIAALIGVMIGTFILDNLALVNALNAVAEETRLLRLMMEAFLGVGE